MKEGKDKIILIIGIIMAVLAPFLLIPLQNSNAFNNKADSRQTIKKEADNEVKSISLEIHERICGCCGALLPANESYCVQCGWPQPLSVSYSTIDPAVLNILEITSSEISLVFSGIVIIEGGDSEKPDSKYWLLKMKWGNDSTVSIPFGSVYHGYRVGSLEKSKDADGKENWQLLLHGKDGKEITLTMNCPTSVEEKRVVLQTTENGSKSKFSAFEGDSFEVEGTTYKILEILKQRITISDIAGNAFIVEMNQ